MGWVDFPTRAYPAPSNRTVVRKATARRQPSPVARRATERLNSICEAWTKTCGLQRPCGTPAIAASWQLPSSGLSCPSPRAEPFSRRINGPNTPPGLLSLQTENMAPSLEGTWWVVAVWATSKRRVVWRIRGDRAGCPIEAAQYQGCTVRPVPLRSAGPRGQSRTLSGTAEPRSPGSNQLPGPSADVSIFYIQRTASATIPHNQCI